MTDLIMTFDLNKVMIIAILTFLKLFSSLMQLFRPNSIVSSSTIIYFTVKSEEDCTPRD